MWYALLVGYLATGHLWVIGDLLFGDLVLNCDRDRSGVLPFLALAIMWPLVAVDMVRRG